MGPHKIESRLTDEVEARAEALQRMLGCSRSGLVVQAINVLAMKYQCFYSPDKYKAGEGPNLRTGVLD